MTTMQATFSNALDIKRMFDAVQVLVKDFNIECGENGFEGSAMDASHVAFVKISIPKESCASYSCNSNHTIGLNMTNLCRFLNSADVKDSLALQMLDHKLDHLGIIISSSDHSRVTNYNMKLMTIDTESLDIPDMDWMAQIELPFNLFSKLIKDLSMLGDIVQIRVTSETISFMIPDGDAGDGGTLLRNVEPVKINSKDEIDLKFSLKYLLTFIKVQITQDNVFLMLSPGLPMRLLFPINDSSVEYYLAPKLDD